MMDTIYIYRYANIIYMYLDIDGYKIIKTF